jgi:hypothetical protein
MFVFCDNFATCNGSFRFSDVQPSDDRLRAAGWHIFDGTTMGGKTHNVKLCRRCAGGRQDKGMPPLLPGEQTMIQIEVATDEPGT